MNAHDIYREAIKRVFANLYGVSPDEVDVSWSSDSDAIIVRCSDKRLLMKFSATITTLRSNSSATSKIRSPSGLNDEERRRLERAI